MSSALPAWHDRCLDVLTGLNDLQPEPRATCGDCVMCAGPERSRSAVQFRPDVKCCSHIPSLPNFLVGRELSDDGHDSLWARIEQRRGVTPLGLGVSIGDVRRIIGAQPGFGRSDAVMCPHFQPETQGCGIWHNRNAVCSTWFCQHERGAVGQRFWHAVRDLLMAAEERLAYLCLVGSDLPQSQVDAVLAHRAAVRETIRLSAEPQPVDAIPEATRPLPRPRATTDSDTEPPIQLDDDQAADWYGRMWGEWQGREEEWFLHCAAMVEQLTPAEIVAHMDGVRHLIDGVAQAWRDRQAAEPPVPQQVAFAPGPGSAVEGDVLRLVGYSEFDPVIVPVSALWPLRLLDAGPASPQDVVEPALLRQLLDFGVVLDRSEALASPAESP